MISLFLVCVAYINPFVYAGTGYDDGYVDYDYSDYCPAMSLDWSHDEYSKLVGISFTIVAGYKYEIQCSQDRINWITVKSFIADWEETPLVESTYYTGFSTEGEEREAYFRVFYVCKEHRYTQTY